MVQRAGRVMRRISIFELSGTLLPSEAHVFPNYRTGTFKSCILKDITSRHVLLCPFPLKPGPHSASSSHSCCEARKQSGNLFYSEKRGKQVLKHIWCCLQMTFFGDCTTKKTTTDVFSASVSEQI